jgi:phage terminase Nu1 subunit (DNA packaging protein)
MNEYTPDTEGVRNVFMDGARQWGEIEARSRPQFDRWLAEHDAQVEAAVLRRAADDWAADPNSWGDNEKDYRNELRDRADRALAAAKDGADD